MKALAVLLITWMSPQGLSGMLLQEYPTLEVCYKEELKMQEVLRQQDINGDIEDWSTTCLADGTELEITLKEKAPK